MFNKTIQIINKKTYNKFAYKFNQTRKYSWKEFDYIYSYLFSSLSNKQINVLDIGCGNGRFYEFLQGKKINFKYIGIDPSIELLKYGIQNYKDAKFLVDTFDFKQDSEYKEKQDLIVSIAALHHLPSHHSQTKALERIYKKLNKGGICAFTTWNLNQDRFKNNKRLSYILSILTFGIYNKRNYIIPFDNYRNPRIYYNVDVSRLVSDIEKIGYNVLNKKDLLNNKGKNHVFICKK